MTPLRDPALWVELGSRPVRALMTQDDWEEQVDRLLDSPPTTPVPSYWERPASPLSENSLQEDTE